MKKSTEDLKVYHMTTSYNLLINGKVERLRRTMEDIPTQNRGNKEGSWDIYINQGFAILW